MSETPRDGAEPRLVAAIRDEILAHGPITFARFMERALYEPGLGYYDAGVGGPGRDLDFLTAPEATPLFGRTLARQVAACWGALGGPATFTLREYGAGTGALAAALLGGLRDGEAGAYRALGYEPVEVSARASAELVARLERDGLADRLPGGTGGWRADATTRSREIADADRAFEGIVVANEFLDALPLHRLTRVGGELREIGVGWRDGQFVDVAINPSSPDLQAYLERTGVPVADGQAIEVNLGIRRWVRDVARDLRRGWIIVIDYAMSARDLGAPERTGGTLKAVAGHRVGNDPYRNVGRQDLTAHVDLTELELAARDAGLDLLLTTTQGPYLAGLGMGELLVAEQAAQTSLAGAVGTRSAARWLLDPHRTGGFAVVILGRGVDVVPSPGRA